MPGGLSARQRLLAEGKLAPLSLHFGITPPDIDEMTGWEIDHYEMALVELAREAEAKQQAAGR